MPPQTDFKMTANHPSAKILVVDDERDVTELIQYHLKKAAYKVNTINNPLDILKKIREEIPDLFILDVMMPGLDGYQLCRMLRIDPACKEVPVLFLTARNTTEDRIKGFESGADDYLSKPFEMRELVLRVDTILRRTRKNTILSKQSLQIEKVELDISGHKLTVEGRKVVLTPTEFRLLRILMERRGRIQSRENLLINAWNYDTDIESRTVDTHIRRLRDKLGKQAHIIETVRGIGYRTVIEEQ